MKVRKVRGALLATALLLAPAAFASDDSSSDARGGFINTLQESQGLIIQVPINEKGEELISESKARIYTGEAITSTSDYAKAFESAKPVNLNQAVTESDVASDSSTSGWYYGPRYYSAYRYYSTPGYYYSPYYYRSYYPSYYHYGSYYPYYAPSWRTYYGSYYPGYGSYYPGYGYYGSRYYHYGRRW